MNQTRLFLPAMAGITLFLFSCGGKQVEFTYEVKDLTFTFEQPYAGPDTKSAEAVLDLEEIFKANGADVKDINKVTLENISIELVNQSNFDKITNFTLELQGDKAPTITVANLPEIEKGKNKLDFPGSEKKDADKHFREGKFYVLLSANFDPSDTLNYELKGTLKFKIKAGALPEKK